MDRALGTTRGRPRVSAWARWGSWWGGVRGGEGERDVRASRSRALVLRPFDKKNYARRSYG